MQGGLRPGMSLATPSMDVQTLDDMAPSRKNITTLEGEDFGPARRAFQMLLVVVQQRYAVRAQRV